MMIHAGCRSGILLGLLLAAGLAFPGAGGSDRAQSASGHSSQFLRQALHFSDDEIKTIERGQPICREGETPDKAEILLYGAVYVKAAPGTFIRSYTEVEKLVDGKGYLAARHFRTPPALEDLQDLNLDADDLQELRTCQPGS